jgi:hypothetical protein
MMIMDKIIDPVAMSAIEQKARDLQFLVSTKDTSITVSSTTTPIDGYVNHHCIYEPWDTGDSLYTMFMPTPTYDLEEMTVISQEFTDDSTYTTKDSSSDDESICWQETMPEFNENSFGPADQTPPDPVKELDSNGTPVLPEDQGPPDPKSNLLQRELMGSIESHFGSRSKKPPDPLNHLKDILGSNPIFFHPKDPKPPDPSPRAIKPKRGIPETKEHPKHKRKKNRKDAKCSHQ